MSQEITTQSSGLKTRVKLGEMTPEEGLAKIAKWNKDTPWLVPERTVKWLKNRSS